MDIGIEVFHNLEHLSWLQSNYSSLKNLNLPTLAKKIWKDIPVIQNEFL